MESEPGDAALATWGSGTQPSKARQRGDALVREPTPWAATVRALLRHYETVGFTGAPRVVGSGVTPDGLDAVTWVEGTSPNPRAWPDEALPALGGLLRRTHDVGATVTPPPHARWQPLFSRTLPGARPGFGHGDVGPWNVLAQPGGGCALIDWEFAGPVDAVWELAQAAWLNAQLHDDDVAEAHDLPAPAARARQVRLLLDGYGLPRADRVGFVEKLIEFAVRTARAEAVDQCLTADSPAITATGFPVLWAVTWRTRSAAWMLDHRQLLERSLA